MKVKLLLLSTAIKPNEFNLILPAKIGRGREASLRLVHGQISRLHCEIYEENGQVMARDLASLNGTFVDDQRLEEPCALVSGCKLKVGSVDFEVLIGDTVERIAPPQRTEAPDLGEAPQQAAKPAEPAQPAGAAAIAEDAQVEMAPAAEPSSETDDMDVAWLFADDEEPQKPKAEATIPAPTAAKTPSPGAAPDPANKQPAAKAPAAPASKPAQPVKKPLPVAKAEPIEPAGDANSDVTTMWKPPPAASPAKQPTAAGPVAKPAAHSKAPATAKPAAAAKPAAEEPKFEVAPEPGGEEPDADLDEFFKSIM